MDNDDKQIVTQRDERYNEFMYKIYTHKTGRKYDPNDQENPFEVQDPDGATFLLLQKVFAIIILTVVVSALTVAVYAKNFS